MEIDNYIKDFSEPKIHSEISKLNTEQKIRIKKFIDEINTKTDRKFTIKDLKVLNDRIEIEVNYKLTMF